MLRALVALSLLVPGDEPIASTSAGDEEDDVPATIVTATRAPAVAFDAPWSTEVIDSEAIERRAYRTTPQALRDIPGVMVQETSYGQGSPYIRGFTGFQNVLLVDGIRLNNSVFRPGPNQYWNTVDPLSLDRLEVVKGPSSVTYGTDAIGGAVNAITKSPYSYGPGVGLDGMVYHRYATADDSFVSRLESSVSRDDTWGVLLGISGKSFDDLSAGSPTGLQPDTGYDELDVDAKLEHYIDPDTRLVLSYQHVFQDDVPRTHRTANAKSFQGTTIGSDLRRDLDQRRQLAYVQLHGENVGSWYDSYSTSLSFHLHEERRSRIRSNTNAEQQGFEVGTLGFFTNLTSDTGHGRLTYGVDAYHDDVDSFSDNNAIQGPVADDATYDLLGAFVQDEIPMSAATTLVLGARVEHAAVDADRVFDPTTSMQTSIEDDWTAVVGTARVVHELRPDELNVFGGVSQGFRAPNLSDLTRLDSALTNEFEIPTPGLDPEHYLSFELGVKAQGERHAAQAAVFYTLIEDGIIRVPTGATTGTGELIVTKANAGDGYVAGIELGASRDIAEGWNAFGNLTLLDGEQDNFPTSAPVISTDPIDRLMPLTFQVGLGWDDGKDNKWFETVVRVAGDADDLSPRDIRDTSRIPPGGTPGYVVLDVRGGMRLSDHLRLEAALENLTDEDYRIHGSGQNMPGLNAIVGVTLTP